MVFEERRRLSSFFQIQSLARAKGKFYHRQKTAIAVSELVQASLEFSPFALIMSGSLSTQEVMLTIVHQTRSVKLVYCHSQR